MTEDEAQTLDSCSDQTLVRYYLTIMECYPGKLVAANTILERLVQRGLATGAGETISLTDEGKAILAAMQTEAYNAHPKLEAALEVATIDLEHWKLIARWSDSELVAWLEHIRAVSPGSAAKMPTPLPSTRMELVNLLEELSQADVDEVV